MPGLGDGKTSLQPDEQRRLRRVAPLIEDSPIEADAEILDAAAVRRAKRQTKQRLAGSAVERACGGAALGELRAVGQDDGRTYDQAEIVEDTELGAHVEPARALDVARHLHPGDAARRRRVDRRILRLAQHHGALPAVLIAEREVQVEAAVDVEGVDDVRHLRRFPQDARLGRALRLDRRAR